MELIENPLSIGSSEIYSHVNQLVSQNEIEVKTVSKFPIDALPKEYQKIILETNKCLNFPIDFIGTSLIYASAVAIGNTCNIKLKNEFIESATIYMAIVASPGANKTHPLNFAMKPLSNYDAESYKKYQDAKKVFDDYKQLPNSEKKEKESLGFIPPDNPIFKKCLVADFTPEALGDLLKNNPRGLGAYVDELAAWFKNFERYSKGSEEQFWLSVWSNKNVIIDRKGTGSILIVKPFLCVGGTIQPKVLKELAGGGRSNNGFLDRILFCMPIGIEKPYWNDDEINPKIIDNWHEIISNLINTPLSFDSNNNPAPTIIEFNSDAKKELVNWQKMNTDRANNTENEALKGIYSKYEVYAIRFSLILQCAKYASNEGRRDEIELESVLNSIKIVEYFIENVTRVLEITSNNIEALTAIQISLMESLPESFTTNQGLIISEKIGIPERTFFDYLKNEKMFSKLKYGHYKKNR